MTEQASSDNRQFELHLRKLDVEIAKLIAETSKISAESKFYPMIVASTATLATVAVVKISL